MTIRYRDAAPADAPLLHKLFAESFTDTFGHLYKRVGNHVDDERIMRLTLT